MELLSISSGTANRSECLGSPKRPTVQCRSAVPLTPGDAGQLSGALLSSRWRVDTAFTGTLPRQQQTLAAVLEQFPGTLRRSSRRCGTDEIPGSDRRGYRRRLP